MLGNTGLMNPKQSTVIALPSTCTPLPRNEMNTNQRYKRGKAILTYRMVWLFFIAAAKACAFLGSIELCEISKCVMLLFALAISHSAAMAGRGAALRPLSAPPSPFQQASNTCKAT